MTKRDKGYEINDMFFAARMGNENEVRVSISKGVSVNSRNYYNETPLIVAAQNGHLNIVNMLIEAGADVHLHDERHHSGLTEAVRIGRTDIIERLLLAGALFPYWILWMDDMGILIDNDAEKAHEQFHQARKSRKLPFNLNKILAIDSPTTLVQELYGCVRKHQFLLENPIYDKLYIIKEFEFNVMNTGIADWITKGGGSGLFQAHYVLQEIGAERTANLVLKALKILNDMYHYREDAFRFLNKTTHEQDRQLSIIEDELHGVPDDLAILLSAYIKKNKESLYESARSASN